MTKQTPADIQDRIEGIIFEGDVVRAWIAQLRKRGSKVKAALISTKAEKSLGMFEAAVAKREGKE